MTGPERWITEAELHAHLDGELQAERCAAVEAGLAADPEQAARLRSYRRHKMLLARAYGPLLERPPCCCSPAAPAPAGGCATAVR